jgi:hypothetical protein
MRRALAWLGGLAIVGSLFLFARTAVAAPTFAVIPSCGAPGAVVQASGSAWSPGSDVTIQFDPKGSPTYSVTVPGSSIGPNGNFTADMTVPARPNSGVAYSVVASQHPPSVAGTVLTATALFYVPCPGITLKPNCGTARQAILVHGEGFRPNFRLGIYFTPPPAQQPDAVTAPKADGSFDIGVAVPARPPGAYIVEAIQVLAVGTPSPSPTPTIVIQSLVQAAAVPELIATAVFEIPCTKGTIKLIPNVGPPGTVTTVIGSGFPVGAVIKLRWSQGIPIGAPSIVVDSSQGFQMILLIYPHDELGLRRLSAAPDLTNPTAPLFNIATADFLVVPGSEQPRNFSWRH